MSKIAICLSFAAFAACTTSAEPPDESSVELQVTTVPTDVRCIGLTIYGPQTRNVLSNVVPGAASNLVLDRLPVGAVRFAAVAYTAGCSTVTAATVPPWKSELLEVTLRAGVVTPLQLVLTPNGIVRVTIDFQTPEQGFSCGGLLDCFERCIQDRSGSSCLDSCGTGGSTQGRSLFFGLRQCAVTTCIASSRCSGIGDFSDGCFDCWLATLGQAQQGLGTCAPAHAACIAN